MAAQTSEAEVRQLLSQAHSAAQGTLGDGTWRVEFAGKEIFHDVGSRICHRPSLGGYNPSPAEFDIDLAKDIAAWQVGQRQVPGDLGDLLTALRRRIAGATSTT